MAACTIRSELRFVHVDMTGSTLLALACKCQVLVTTDAAGSLVPSFKCEARRRMVKRRIGAHLPRIGRVTFLARNIDLSMRRSLCIAADRADNQKRKEYEQLFVHFTRSWQDSQRDGSGL